MRSLQHTFHKLRELPEMDLDQRTVMLGKHRILAEVNRRQQARGRERVRFGDAVSLWGLRMTRRLIPQRQLVFGLLIIVMLSSSTRFIAQAAVPGDFLWPVKLSFEKAEVAFAVSAIQEGRVHIRHVDSRLRELSVVVSRPESPRKSENISQLVRRLEKDITAASHSLKISKEEQTKTAPQVVAALAMDLTAKASEAVRALEENKNALSAIAPEAVTKSLSSIALSTSTDPLMLSSELAFLGTEATSTGESAEEASQQEEKRNLAQVIVEVQIVNEYISYTALEAMIEMVELRGSGNRAEVTALLQNRILEQRGRVSDIEKISAQVSNDFLLPKFQTQQLARDAHALLDAAEDFVVLDNLSVSLAKLSESKNVISRAAKLLQEVHAAGGIVEEEPEPVKQQTPVLDPGSEVSAQSVPSIEVTVQTVQLSEETADAPFGE
ncbi:MAG: DUF5667 domain-containing protein [Patescibacteria group bacterium]